MDKDLFHAATWAYPGPFSLGGDAGATLRRARRNRPARATGSQCVLGAAELTAQHGSRPSSMKAHQVGAADTHVTA